MTRRSSAYIVAAGLLLAALTLAGCGSPPSASALATPPSQATNAPALSATQPGGDALAPTAEPAPETPASPRALQVAFVKEGNVWLWREGAEPMQLTRDGGAWTVKVSPDGAIVAFIRDDELIAVNTDGTQERRLVSTADLAALAADAGVAEFAWQPGSHTLVYNTYKLSQVGAKYDDLRQVDADSLAKGTLLAPGQGGEFCFSPDGSRIAVAVPGKVSLIDAGGTSRQDVLAYDDPSLIYPRPVWAADGSCVVVATPSAGSTGQPAQETTIWRLPVDGSAATPMAKIPSGDWSSVAISPDLAYAGYDQAPAAKGQLPQLAIVALGTDETTVYAEDAGGIVGWAPDSQHFVFNSTALVGQLDAEPIPVCDACAMPGMASDLRWVDAGHYLFLLSKQGGGWDLVLGAIGGTNQLVATLDTASSSYDFSH